MSKLSASQHKILIIDDNEKILALMKDIFSSKNYKVITKQSGAEGLECIKEKDFVSVVISDFQMKGMTGLEFLQQVKALSPITKRCLCSGSFDKKTLEKKVQDKEIDAFMMKPVNFAKMLTTIDTFVENLGEKIILLPLTEPTETGDYIQDYKNKKEKFRG